jgi:glucokinase
LPILIRFNKRFQLVKRVLGLAGIGCGKREAVVGAVDIGGTKLALGVVDDQGWLLAKAEVPTDVARGFDHAMREISTLLRDCAQRAGVKLRGIGIGCTGQVDAVTGALGEVHNLPGWTGGNPVVSLSREFSVPVALENDADAAALGELYWGSGKSRTPMIYVTVGTGIGVSVILDGKIYRGAGQCHPEIGHQVIDPAGPPCTCGARGCWESLASGPAMVMWIENNGPKSYPCESLTAREVCSRAAAGDEWARRAVEHVGYYLGLGLANLVNIFAPQAIVLGGSVMKSAPLFLPRLHEVIRQNCRLVPYEKIEISLASLGTEVGLIGAAQVWHHRFERCGGRIE